MTEPEDYSDEEYSVGQAMSEPENYTDEEYNAGEEMSDCFMSDCDCHCVEEEQMSEPDQCGNQYFEVDHMAYSDSYGNDQYDDEVEMSEPDHFSDDQNEEDYMEESYSCGDEQDEQEQMSELQNQSDDNFSELVAETEERVATLTAERRCLMTTIQVLEADVKCLRAVLDILEDQEPDDGTRPPAPSTATSTPEQSSLTDALSQAHNELKHFLRHRDCDFSGGCSDPEHYSEGEVSVVGEQDDGIIRHQSTEIQPPRVRPGRRTGVRLLIAEPQRPVAEGQVQETYEEHVARLQLIEITDMGDPTGDNHPHVCSTCVTNKISYMVTPCNHVSLCGPCVKMHRRGLRSDDGILLNYVCCPNCAQKVEGYVRVFL